MMKREVRAVRASVAGPGDARPATDRSRLHPELDAAQHDGREISVYAVLVFESGTAALYLSREDAEYSISPNAVGLKVNPNTRYVFIAERTVEPRRLTGRHVRVRGVVDATGDHALQRWRVLLKDVREVIEQAGTKRW